MMEKEVKNGSEKTPTGSRQTSTRVGRTSSGLDGPRPNPRPSRLVFGQHKIPLEIDEYGIRLSIQQEGDVLSYRRECMDETVEKTISAHNAQVLINPVEPVNKPKEITPYLLVEFERPIVVEPAGRCRVYVKTPVEIGVFVSAGGDFQVLDILTLRGQKFTLYGDPRRGVICRHCSSPVYASIPEADPLQEGVMEIDIVNPTEKWIEVAKGVFSCYGMKVYFSDRLVSMKADMEILSERSAETDFSDSPVRENMTGSIELYTSRKLLVATTKFLMGEGI
jgi:hypothetical protein